MAGTPSNRQSTLASPYAHRTTEMRGLNIGPSEGTSLVWPGAHQASPPPELIDILPVGSGGPLFYVDENGCWIWTGNINPANGYGRFSRRGLNYQAHRVAYVVLFGEPPAGFGLDHTCRVRECINPYHLEAVTRTDNCRRGARAKLSMDKARRIREMRELGWAPKDIAPLFGVHPQTIRSVLRGKCWYEDLREDLDNLARSQKPIPAEVVSEFIARALPSSLIALLAGQPASGPALSGAAGETTTGESSFSYVGGRR